MESEHVDRKGERSASLNVRTWVVYEVALDEWQCPSYDESGGKQKW